MIFFFSECSKATREWVIELDLAIQGLTRFYHNYFIFGWLSKRNRAKYEGQWEVVCSVKD